jgi:hypothetical protein
MAYRVSEADYIVVVVTAEHKETARALAARGKSEFEVGSSRAAHQYGHDFKRFSWGCLGQVITADYYGCSPWVETMDYDFIIPTHRRVEVKTITCTVKPRADYYAMVNSCKPEGVHKQNTDYYVFCRVLGDASVAWILGWLGFEEFWERGKFMPKGSEIAPGIKLDMANGTAVFINELYRATEL